jgi:hypothetical protein
MRQKGGGEGCRRMIGVGGLQGQTPCEKMPGMIGVAQEHT